MGHFRSNPTRLRSPSSPHSAMEPMIGPDVARDESGEILRDELKRPVLRTQSESASRPEVDSTVPTASVAEKGAVWLAEAVSRRSFLAVVGRAALAVTGAVAFTQLVPHDRRASASHVCSHFPWCGLCGTRCNCCSGGSAYSCGFSGCTLATNWWTACCNGKEIAYIDCCDCGNNCPGCDCSNNCPQPAWCNGYRCTYAVVRGHCP